MSFFFAIYQALSQGSPAAIVAQLICASPCGRALSTVAHL